MYPYTFTPHVLRAPFVSARFFRDRPARDARIFDCVGWEGDVCDARIQRSEQERLEQRRFACMHVQFGCRSALSDLDEPGGRERGEEVVAQDTDIADRRG
jgi:hypothetical protein